MGSLIEIIEGSSIATFVRESPSIFGYTSVLSLHAIGLAFVVGVGAVLALRLLGFPSGIPAEAVSKLYRLMWLGFAVNAASGFALLAASAATMLVNVTFLIKMLLIVLAIVNMELLRGRLRRVAASTGAAAGLGDRALAISALVLWTAVIVAGRLTAYPYFVRSLLGGA